jgi:hypothetical protein
MELIPKEKARELYDKHYSLIRDFVGKHDYVKEVCIIAVDEIIKQWEYIDTYIANGMGKLNLNLKYWNEVKAELENI